MIYTDVNQLTPERKADWDAAKSVGERKNLMTLWDLEDQQAALNAQPAPTEVAGTQETPAEHVVAEVQTPVETNTQVPPDEVKNEEPTQTIEYFVKLAEEKAKEAENWKKRKSDADRTLEPTQQENAKLRKENGELSEKLSKIEALLEKMSQAPQKPTVFLDQTDDFTQNYPEIAERMAFVKQELESKYEKKLEETVRPLKEKLTYQEDVSFQEQNRAREMAHFAAVKAMHPDAEDFIGQKYGPALVEWAKIQPPYVSKIISNPLDFDPSDVGDVITRFKQATGLSKRASVPSGGDIATKVNSHTSVVTAPPPADIFDESFTERDFNSLMSSINRRQHDHDVINNALKRDEAMDMAMAKWERTLNHRFKQ